MRQHIPTRWTRPEQRFQEMCQKHDLPFKYTGNGSFWIGGLNPDFIDSTGQKRVVEIFSDYWHNPEKRVLKESQTEEGRKRIFSELGWGCIIIWERETKSEDQMLTKLSILLDSSWAA